MQVTSIINKVEDGVITSVTYETKKDEELVQRCLIEFPDSGELGIIQSSEIFTDDKELIKESFMSIRNTLVNNGIRKLDVRVKDEDAVLGYLP